MRWSEVTVVQHPSLCEMVQKCDGNWHGCKAFTELFSGAGEQTLSSCLVYLPAEAEQVTLQGHYRRLLHTGVGVPCVLFWSYICCAKWSCQGVEVVMEFSSWKDSKKLQCMWNIIKEIKPEASVIILGGCQPSGDCSRQAESHLCYYEGASTLSHKCSKASAGHGWRVIPSCAARALCKEAPQNRVSW